MKPLFMFMYIALLVYIAICLHLFLIQEFSNMHNPDAGSIQVEHSDQKKTFPWPETFNDGYKDVPKSSESLQIKHREIIQQIPDERLKQKLEESFRVRRGKRLPKIPDEHFEQNQNERLLRNVSYQLKSLTNSSVNVSNTNKLMAQSIVKQNNETKYDQFQTLTVSKCPHWEDSLWPKLPPSNAVNQTDKCTDVHFSSTPLPSTALASFPGCGNTWTRYLIEQVTGVWTGSRYNDPFLSRGGFRGEGIKDGRVVVMKTHWPYIKRNASSVEKYPRAVLVLRNPQQCLLAEFHRRHSSSHTGQAPDEIFKTSQWTIYIKSGAKSWLKFYKSWLEQDACILVVDFQRLQENLGRELHQLAHFLGVQEDITDRIKCIVENSNGHFKRKAAHDYSVFSEELKVIVESHWKELADILEKKVNYQPVFTWLS